MQQFISLTLLFFLTRLRTISVMSLRYFLSLTLLILRFLLQNVPLLFTRYNFLVILLLRVFSGPQNKTQTILDIRLPRTLSQANRFLGKIDYYGKLILDFARTGAPFHKVTNRMCTKRHESD